MACYNLKDIRKLAKQGAIEYMGRVASRDAAQLGYSFHDVVGCLQALTESEFSATKQYENGPKFDVYLTKYPRPNSEDDGLFDELYVKFALINNKLTISIASFHLQRWG